MNVKELPKRNLIYRPMRTAALFILTFTPNGIAKAKQFERHILLLVNHISRMGLVLTDREMYSCACAMLDALPASTLERLNLDFSVKLEVTSNTRG